MLRVETNQKYAKTFCDWLAARFPPSDRTTFDENTRTIGHVDVTTSSDGKVKIEILAVAAFHHWSPHSVEITVGASGAKRQKNSREFIWTVFDYIFNFAEKSSLFATVSVRNTKCLALTEAIGFTQRGSLPDFFGEDHDGLVFTLTKREWQSGRWAEKTTTDINIPITAKQQYQSKETVH